MTTALLTTIINAAIKTFVIVSVPIFIYLCILRATLINRTIFVGWAFKLKSTINTYS